MARGERDPAASGPAGVVADRLGVAEDPLLEADPASFARVLVRAGMAAALHPFAVLGASTRLARGQLTAMLAAMRRAVGGPAAGPVAPDPKDWRFADTAFEENPLFFLAAQQYLLAREWALDVVEAADLPEAEATKARFAARFVLDALAPTNSLAGNPQAIRKAFDTGGKSVARGLRNWLADVRHNDGWPSQVDRTPFELGVNTAATPGKVVYRNGLMELIQYEPQTPTVHEVPLVFCPPWINKYYILDLAPGKSLIEWAVQHGHTCFAISYRNPDASMRDTGFDDYMHQGPLEATRVVRAITGRPAVNLLSLCLGGTLSAVALAYQAGVGDRDVNTATFLNTHTDFSHPGVLGVYTDEGTVAALEARMQKQGYLDGKQMARTFDTLRPNDLVFRYVVRNWLMGEDPPAFDLLAWNADTTRMPAKMHATYLRACYLENRFARGELEVDGHVLDPGKVEVDAYVLSAIEDHIVPWQSAYKTAHLLGGDNRFVLSTSGHIAGIVNPPSPKARHWTNEHLHEDPEAWLAGATLVEDTWWNDWAAWIGERAGKRVRARKTLGSDEHPPIEDAPGTYVRET